jgi:hypothetical protein
MYRIKTYIWLIVVTVFYKFNCSLILFAQQPDSINFSIDYDYISRTQGVKHIIPTLPILFSDLNQTPDFTDKTAKSFIDSHENPVSFIHLIYRLAGATAGGYGPPLSGVGDPFHLNIKNMDQTYQDFNHQFGLQFRPGSKKEWQKLSSAYRIEILKTIYTIYRSDMLVTEFLMPVNSSIITSSDSIERNYQQLFKPWKEKQLTDFTTFGILPSMDLKKLSFASRILMEQTYRLINLDNAPVENDFSQCIIETQFGLIGIFGNRNDTIDENYTLLVNLGGNDQYHGNPASSVDSKSRISILVDLMGDDKYSPKEGFLVAGIMGIGLLFDLQGNDIYTSNKPGIAHSFFGTSLLYDRAGNDIYSSGSSFSQGSAHMGAALLIDFVGGDTYNCEDYSQGFGGTLGVGLLMDREGNDLYNQGASETLPSFVQGAACGRWAEATDGQSLGGGYGIFLDIAGNDKYGASSFSQGASYYFGMGVFYEGSGDDKYNAISHSQGYSAHYGLASFYEMKGDDEYNKKSDKSKITQIIGGGRDNAAGLFIEMEGNDIYYVGNRSAGIGDLHGIGLLADYEGNDTYIWYKNSVNSGSSSFGKTIGISQGMDNGFKVFMHSEKPNTGILHDLHGDNKFAQK